MGEEQRQSKRVPIEAEIFCEGKPFQGERGKGNIIINTANISGNGIFLETSVPFALCTIIYLRFILPGSTEEILCEGKVARHHTDLDKKFRGMGIEFTRISFRDKRRIEEYIDNLAKSEDGPEGK
jgi:c-di-GMP-binding flagellar brake protein YcgR